MTITVLATAVTGKISVMTADGTGISTDNFVVIKPPTITSFTPTSGKVGAIVTITGTSFNAVSAVKFNGKAAQFLRDSSTQIRAKVPVGATSGPISVTTSAGTGTSASSFSVTP